MANSLGRVGTASLYAASLRSLQSRQSDLAGLQENITAGKRILRASDDPTSAARAERATTRISRIASDQRALQAQRSTAELGESTLGEATATLQSFRELVISAGNGTLATSDRASIAQQLTGLRNQLFAQANTRDSNGVPLFSGLGSLPTPFLNASTVQYMGLGGQRVGGESSIAPTIDGQAAFMNVPTGNGTFTVATAAANTGTASADSGQVTNPSAVLGNSYSIAFAVTAGVTTYTVTDATTSTTAATGTYKENTAIAFDGLAITVKGTPASGDTLLVAPSTTRDIFGLLDQAIADILSAKNSAGALPTQLAQSLAQLDAGMSRVQAARGLAGDALNQADRIDSALTNRSTQLEGERSSEEDLDMIKALSEAQNKQTGYSAALQSYAQIQKLSLFNFLG